MDAPVSQNIQPSEESREIRIAAPESTAPRRSNCLAKDCRIRRTTSSNLYKHYQRLRKNLEENENYFNPTHTNDEVKKIFHLHRGTRGRPPKIEDAEAKFKHQQQLHREANRRAYARSKTQRKLKMAETEEKYRAGYVGLKVLLNQIKRASQSKGPGESQQEATEQRKEIDNMNFSELILHYVGPGISQSSQKERTANKIATLANKHREDWTDEEEQSNRIVQRVNRTWPDYNRKSDGAKMMEWTLALMKEIEQLRGRNHQLAAELEGWAQIKDRRLEDILLEQKAKIQKRKDEAAENEVRYLFREGDDDTDAVGDFEDLEEQLLLHAHIVE
ncbi:hypothetical protein Dda_6958 [Drechslerella dactyloides]|uniref:Uncharacterized protein n=1 Tax=Drechslerella dactyloides TaxID=74499 RepID=A0AAD6IWK5_DREDA|nr:hypothetical protein Dda_6958 [Drechslerella dactyloides]